MPPRGAKTPQDSENGAKMEPSWHQNRSTWKVIFENLKIFQIVLSLQRGLDFRRFGVWFSDVKSMIFKRFFRRESARRPKTSTRCYKTLPRRSTTPPRCPETPPRRAQGATRQPRSTPRRPQEEAQHEPGVEKIGIEKRSPAEPLANLDFGTSWGGFG